MSDKSGIQWTESTWNPVTGCSKVSQGCKNCYALREWPRLSAPRPRPNVYTGREFTDVMCHPERLGQPLRWTKPRRVFVNSMSDLFHESVPFHFIDDVFLVMRRAKQHTFQILTKRPQRMIEWADSTNARWDDILGGREGKLVPNVWLGVSVEEQATADERIPLLLQTPAAVRFVSYEPALGAVDFSRINLPDGYGRSWIDALRTWYPEPHGAAKIDWLIVGGESGPRARPCDIAWIRSTVEQCKAAGVACFVKQFGADPQFDQGCGDCDPCIGGGQCCVGAIKIRFDLIDRKGGDMQEWPIDLRVREFPSASGGCDQ